jgi:translation initiation factor eIF-2B subunit delta
MSIPAFIQEKITSLKDDNTHGASELARNALDILQVAASESQTEDPEQFLDDLNEVSERLISIHPAMAPIYNLVKRLQASLMDYKNSDAAVLKKAAITIADEMIRLSVNASARIAENALVLINPKETIMTHSYSSTVAVALKKAYEKHRIDIIVTRSGSSRIGQRAAWEFAYSGIQQTYIDDPAIGLYIPQASKVMIGADRICNDGGVINGVGTYLMALAAKRHGIPFYVLAETAKFDTSMPCSEIEHEDRNQSELVAPGILPEGVTVRNPYFDSTPLDLVTGVISEEGLIPQSEIPGYIAKLTSELSLSSAA